MAALLLLVVLVLLHCYLMLAQLLKCVQQKTWK
jgi:hypothetical protein